MNKEKNGGFIQYLVIIAVILGVAFLSQQAFTRPFGVFVYNWSAEKTGNYWSKIPILSKILGDKVSGTTNWLGASFYPHLEKEVENRGDTLKGEVVTQKDNAAKSVWGKIKNYFAEKFSKISGTKVE